MKPHPLLLLALAACGHSWPQLLPGDRRHGLPARLPVVADNINVVTLPIRPGSAGELPVDEKVDVARAKRQFLNLDIDVPSLHSSGPSKRGVETTRDTDGRNEARQFLNEDIEVPSIHSTGPSKRGVETRRERGGQKEARQFLNEELEIPSLHSSGPSKRDVETERELGAHNKARQFLNEDLEVPSLHSSVSGSKRASEAASGAGARMKARQFHNDDIAGVSSIHSTGPSRSRRAAKLRLPVDEDLDMSTVTLPVSQGGRVSARRDKETRQFHNDDMTDIPSIHSTGPSRSKRASKIQLPVDEDLDMSTVTLPVWTRTKDVADRKEARQLPGGGVDSPGVLTLPVLHSTKRGIFSRAIEVELANRSDVAYYAQRKPSTIPSSQVSSAPH